VASEGMGPAQAVPGHEAPVTFGADRCNTTGLPRPPGDSLPPPLHYLADHRRYQFRAGHPPGCGEAVPRACKHRRMGIGNGVRNALGGASKVGASVGAALVVIVWVVVDFLLGITYGIYRLARRPR
jgi:hypothetical protein